MFLCSASLYALCPAWSDELRTDKSSRWPTPSPTRLRRSAGRATRVPAADSAAAKAPSAAKRPQTTTQLPERMRTHSRTRTRTRSRMRRSARLRMAPVRFRTWVPLVVVVVDASFIPFQRPTLTGLACARSLQDPADAQHALQSLRPAAPEICTLSGLPPLGFFRRDRDQEDGPHTIIDTGPPFSSPLRYPPFSARQR